MKMDRPGIPNSEKKKMNIAITWFVFVSMYLEY